MRTTTGHWLWAFVPLVFLALGGGAVQAQPYSYSWTTGTSNSWGGTTWTRSGGTGIPGSADSATISVAPVNSVPYTVSVVDARAVNAVSLARTEATLAVTAGGSLTVGGGFTLSGGTLSTTGTTTVAGTFATAGTAAVIDNSGGGLVLNGAFNFNGGKIVGGTVTASQGGAFANGNGATVDGASTVLKLAGGSWTWTSGAINLNNGATLRIESGATLTDTVNNNHFTSTGGGTIDNFGTLEKTVGGAGSRIGNFVTLNNAGTWRVTSGSWNIESGVVNNTGVIDIGSAGSVSVNGGTLNLNAGTSVTGSGAIVLPNSAGTLNVNGNVTTEGGLTIGNGHTGGTGSITVGGAFDFGNFDGQALTGFTVIANGGGDWTGTSTPFIGTGGVNITGGTVTSSGHSITFKGNGFLTVGANGTLNLTGDTGISVDPGFSPTVTVSGLFKKSAGTGTSGIDPDAVVTVASGGVVDAQTGTINFQGTTLTNNGTIKGSTGTIYFNAATTISGSGTLQTDATGTLTVGPSGGTATVTQSGGTFTNNGTLNVTAGTFKIASGVSLTNYNSSTHTLTGGVWNLTNGSTLNLDGRTISTIAAGTTVTLSGSTANVTGLSSLTQVNGFLRVYNGPTFTPLATVNNGGTVEVSGTFGGAMTVTSTGILTGFGTVNGTVTVQSGGEITPGPGPFNASGTRILTTGTLNLNGGGKYTWEINSWAANASAGNASNGFDQVKGISGVKLNLAGASAANPVVLKITSLNGSAPGQIANFDNTIARSWTIADFSNGNTSGGIQNFSADKFTLDTSGFLNDLGGGTFSITTSANGNQLILSFTPVPEPATVLLVGAAGLAVAGRCRRRNG